MPIGAQRAHSATGTFCADGVQDVGVQSQSWVHVAVPANQVFNLGPANNLAFRDLSKHRRNIGSYFLTKQTRCKDA